MSFKRTTMIQVVLTERDNAQYLLQINKIKGVKEKVPQMELIMERTFDSRDVAIEEYDKIVAHPFPVEQKKFQRSELREAQEMVPCFGKTTRKGEDREYRVPGRLKTYTRRGYQVELEPLYDSEEKMLYCAAKLTKTDDQSVVNVAYGSGPWAALEMLAVLTHKWHSYAKNPTMGVRCKELKRSDVPNGALLDGPEGVTVEEVKVVEDLQPAKAKKPELKEGDAK